MDYRQATRLIFVLCWLILLVGTKAGQTDRRNPVPVPGQWRLSPLVRVGNEVPDVANARFQEFDDVFLAESGAIYFWGGWGKRDEEWGLFSLAHGKLRAISPVGEKVIPPSLQQLPNKEPDKISLHRFGHDQKMMAGLHIKTPIHIGKNHLYLSVEEVYQAMSRPENSSVYVWDGTYLKKLLGKEGEFTGVEMGGMKYVVMGGTVLNVSTQGEALIYFLAGPLGMKAIAKTRRGLALCSGSQLKPLLISGDSLPGMPEVKFLDVDISNTYYAYWTDKPRTAVWASPEATLAILRVGGASYKKALFRLTGDKSEKIIAVGDPDPLDAKKSIHEILRIEVADKDTFAILVNRSSRSDLALLFYQRGKLQVLFDATAAERESGWNELYFGDFKFIRTDPVQVLLGAITAKTTTSMHIDYYRTVFTSKKSIRPDYYVYDGQHPTRITKDASLYYFALRTMSGDYSGTIIGGVSLNWFAGVSSSITEAEVRKNISAQFLDFTSRELKLQALPEFITEDNRRVPLSDVVAWQKTGQSVVRLEDGIYHLSKER